MKKLSALFTWLLLAGCASAAPYIVYSGSIVGSNFSAGGGANATTQVYVITDVANTSSFAVLLEDPVHKTYSVIGRPSDSPTSDEPLNNFLGSVGSRVVLAYSIQSTDSNNNTSIARAYATGLLSTHSTILASARKSLVVPIKTNRVANGTYTFSTSTSAVTTGDLPYAVSLAGTSEGYVIDSGGSLTHATTTGNLSLRISPILDVLANIGGAYSVNLGTEIAVMPVSIASGQSESDAFVAWLSAFAQANGYTTPSTNSANNALGSSFSGGVDVSGGTLSLGGSISGGSTLTVVGAGTLELSGNNGVSTAVNASTLLHGNVNVGSGILTIGGAATGTTTGTTTITGTDTTGSLTFNLSNTATLTLIDTGSLTINSASGGLTIGSGLTNSGTFTLIGTGTGTTTSTDGTISITNPSAIFTLTNATVSLTAINGGNVDGSVVLVTTGGAQATLNFAGTALTLNGSTDLSSLNAGQSLTGTVTVTGGTSVSGTYTGGTMTVTAQ